MIYIDGIIFSLQTTGGISVVFRELIQRLADRQIPFRLGLFDRCDPCCATKHIELQKARIAERYRKCKVVFGASVFHSTYYRVPISRELPVVTTVHDFTYERFNSGPRRWLHSSQKFHAIRRANAIICVSEATKRDLLEFLPEIPQDRINVVYNGVSEKFYPVDGVPNISNPYILFVGARGGYKNFDIAVDTVSNIKEFSLCCVGGGAFSCEEKKILEKKLKGRYWHAGKVTTEDLNLLYNGAFGLLYPSSYEGFGIPILEAMRSGCPVVAVNSSSIPEIAGDSALLVGSADPELLTQAILSLDCARTRSAFRERGLIHSQLFSWDKTFDQTIDVYEKLIGRPL